MGGAESVWSHLEQSRCDQEVLRGVCSVWSHLEQSRCDYTSLPTPSSKREVLPLTPCRPLIKGGTPYSLPVPYTLLPTPHHRGKPICRSSCIYINIYTHPHIMCVCVYARVCMCEDIIIVALHTTYGPY